MRSLLFERPVEKLRIYGDSIRFVGILFIIAALGSLYSVLILSLVYQVCSVSNDRSVFPNR